MQEMIVLLKNKGYEKISLSVNRDNYALLCRSMTVRRRQALGIMWQLVNASSSDVRFSEYPEEGDAKKWLYENKKVWCQTQILVIKTDHEEKEESKTEVLYLERELVKLFYLFES